MDCFAQFTPAPEPGLAMTPRKRSDGSGKNNVSRGGDVLDRRPACEGYEAGLPKLNMLNKSSIAGMFVGT